MFEKCATYAINAASHFLVYWVLLTGMSAWAGPAAAVALPSALVKAPTSGIQADEERDFARAKGLLDQGKEAESLASWTDFLRRYPTSSLADDAQFFLAETLFRQRKFSEALLEFRKVLNYGVGQSSRIPDSALRMGDCWFQLKEYTRARIEWEAVRRRFPNSDAALKAQTLVAGIPK